MTPETALKPTQYIVLGDRLIKLLSNDNVVLYLHLLSGAEQGPNFRLASDLYVPINQKLKSDIDMFRWMTSIIR